MIEESNGYSYSECPKCHFQSPSPLPISEPCPSCGIYVHKWKQVLPRKVFEAASTEAGGGLALLLQPLEKMEAGAFYGRCFILLMLTVWSWSLIGYDYRDGEMSGSFMHAIVLPIHEAGHVLFIPFGEFMTILGGSLFQIIFPLGIGIAFVVVNRDNFGAAIGVWWASVSLLDLSPYIYDAFLPQLILLGGHTGEDGPHDWIYLLGVFGHIRNSQHWGALVHSVGSVMVVCALVWAAVVIWRQRGCIQTGLGEF